MASMFKSKEALKNIIKVAMLSVSACWTAGIPYAQADTVNCTAITAPTTIASPGVYCLAGTANLNLATGAAITVVANDVTIDFNDNAIINNDSAYGGQAVGVLSIGTTNFTVKNGTVRGFPYGIGVIAGASLSFLPTVKNMRVSRAYRLGIGLESVGAIVENCQVINIGKERPGFPANFNAGGIALAKLSSNNSTGHLLDNDIIGISDPPYFGSSFTLSKGVQVERDQTTFVERNRITAVGDSLGTVGSPVFVPGFRTYSRDNVSIIPMGGSVSIVGNY